jgi:hypothetical protein
MICHLILIYPLCTILHIQLSIQTSVSSHLINISSRVMKAKVETSKKSSAISDLRDHRSWKCDRFPSLSQTHPIIDPHIDEFHFDSLSSLMFGLCGHFSYNN